MGERDDAPVASAHARRLASVAADLLESAEPLLVQDLLSAAARRFPGQRRDRLERLLEEAVQGGLLHRVGDALTLPALTLPAVPGGAAGTPSGSTAEAAESLGRRAEALDLFAAAQALYRKRGNDAKYEEIRARRAKL